MEAEQSHAEQVGNLGRYALYGEIASGGMATVHLARLIGSVGFARTVAIKRLHPHLAKDPEFVAMFLEEARLAARVQHPNVVTTLDVVSDEGELFLVMEYVAGESLSRLVRKTREAGKRVSPGFAVSIMSGVLEGLHAAHEAVSERGIPLGIVHRDVSPQNVHVGVDGIARVLDFGIAKATNRVQETRTDQIKGKIAYMSPEQLAKGAIDRRADVYSASVVLWEALTGKRLFKADDVPSLVYAIVNDDIVPPSTHVPDLPKELDAIIMKGLSREASDRWSSAREMAEALENALPPTAPRHIGEWVKEMAGDALAWRIELVQRIESQTSKSIPPPVRVDSPARPMEVASGVVTNGVLGAREPEAPEPADEPAAAPVIEAPAPSDSALDVEAPVERRSVASTVMFVVAALLLLGGAGFFGYRWLQFAGDAPGGDAPAPSATTPATDPSASASAVVTTPVAVRPSAAPAPKPVFVPKPPDDCDDPFTIDSRGIRHPKPKCFKR